VCAAIPTEYFMLELSGGRHWIPGASVSKQSSRTSGQRVRSFGSLWRADPNSGGVTGFHPDGEIDPAMAFKLSEK
jgi:hypothetical protein